MHQLTTSNVKGIALRWLERISSDEGIPPWEKEEKLREGSRRAVKKAKECLEEGLQKTFLEAAEVLSFAADSFSFSKDNCTISRWFAGNRLDPQFEGADIGAELLLDRPNLRIGEGEQRDLQPNWEERINFRYTFPERPNPLPREKQKKLVKELLSRVSDLETYKEAVQLQRTLGAIYGSGELEYSIWAWIRNRLSRKVLNQFSKVVKGERETKRWRFWEEPFDLPRPTRTNFREWRRYVDSKIRVPWWEEKEEKEYDGEGESLIDIQWEMENTPWKPSKPLEPTISHFMLPEKERETLYGDIYHTIYVGGKLIYWPPWTQSFKSLTERQETFNGFYLP